MIQLTYVIDVLFVTDGFVGYHRGAKSLINVDRLGSSILWDRTVLFIKKEMLKMKKVAVIMGSDSDLPVVEKSIDTLREYGVPFEVHVYSAHRTPYEAREFSANARENGFGVIIAAAGKAAHLAGALAANTTLPVIGLPVKSSTLDGLDALLSTVQMPSGIPVATVAIDGAVNAALLAIQILAVYDQALADKLDEARKKGSEKVLQKNRAIEGKFNN